MRLVLVLGLGLGLSACTLPLAVSVLEIVASSLEITREAAPCITLTDELPFLSLNDIGLTPACLPTIKQVVPM